MLGTKLDKRCKQRDHTKEANWEDKGAKDSLVGADKEIQPYMSMLASNPKDQDNKEEPCLTLFSFIRSKQSVATRCASQTTIWRRPNDGFAKTWGLSC